METVETKRALKNTPKFECKFCYFLSSKKSDMFRHLTTSKHQNNVNGNNQEIIETFYDVNKCKIKSHEFTCVNCSKNYKNRSGLWKHNKICNSLIKKNENFNDNNYNEEKKNEILTNETIIQLIKQNQDFQKMLLEQNQKNQELMMELAKNVGNVINSHNTTNNNKFNMNIFLNETCKDAMNIMDFVSSLKISFEDLENVGEVGYVKGITNIISNGLNKLDVHKRPIHCSDVKREVFYVKDNGVWEKETEDKKKITRAIKHISYNTARKVTPWTELPENAGVYDYYNKLNDKYSRISSQANGGDPDEVSKIIKNIASKVTIDKNDV